MLTKHKEQATEREVYISDEAFTPINDPIQLLVDVLVDHYQNASRKIQGREIIVKLYNLTLEMLN
jgi:hypothetical protein